MAFVPISNLPYTLSGNLILQLSDSSHSDISSTKLTFYVKVGNNTAVSVGSITGRLDILTTLSAAQISQILDVSKSGGTSRGNFATWYAVIQTPSATTTTTSASLDVTIPESKYYPKLSATPTFTDSLTATKNLTGNPLRIVLNASTLVVNGTVANSSEYDPSPITSWYIQNGSKKVIGSGATTTVQGSITKPTSPTVTIGLTNGRGVSRTYTYTMPNVVAYKVPTISITSLTRSTSDLTKVNIKYTISMFTGNFGSQSNTATVVTKSGVANNGTVSTWTTVKTNTGIAASSLTVSNLTGYSEDNNYGFKGTLTDALNTANTAQSILPTALPVLAFSPDSADLFGMLHLHARDSTIDKYLAIYAGRVAGAIQRKNVTDDSTVNYIYLYDDRIVTPGDVVANGVYLLNSLFYASGDSITLNPTTPYPAYVTDSVKTIRITIHTAKSLQRINTITVTQMIGAIQSVSGYVNIPNATAAGSHATDWKVSGVTITATKVDNYTIRVQLTGSSAFYNATNNRPMVYVPSYGGIKFSLT